MARSERSAKATIDHETIREWVEARGGCPAHVKGSGGKGDPGILRIDFTGFSGVDTLEKISWDEFFDSFEANQLAFLYQDTGDSRFNKLVSRDSVDVGERGRQGRGKQRGGSSGQHGHA